MKLIHKPRHLLDTSPEDADKPLRRKHTLCMRCHQTHFDKKKSDIRHPLAAATGPYDAGLSTAMRDQTGTFEKVT